jgi:hypothetical protein
VVEGTPERDQKNSTRRKEWLVTEYRRDRIAKIVKDLTQDNGPKWAELFERIWKGLIRGGKDKRGSYGRSGASDCEGLGRDVKPNITGGRGSPQMTKERTCTTADIKDGQA